MPSKTLAAFVILLHYNIVGSMNVSSAYTDFVQSTVTGHASSSLPLYEASLFLLSSPSISLLSSSHTYGSKEFSSVLTNQPKGSFPSVPESTIVFNISISQLERAISSSFQESIEFSSTEIISTGISKLPEGIHSSFWSFLDDSSYIISSPERHITSSFVDHFVTPSSFSHSSVWEITNSVTGDTFSSKIESSFEPFTSIMFTSSEDISSTTTLNSAAVFDASQSIVVNETLDVSPSSTSASIASRFQLLSSVSSNTSVNPTDTETLSILSSASLSLLSPASSSDIQFASIQTQHEIASLQTYNSMSYSSSLSDLRSDLRSQYSENRLDMSSSILHFDHSFVSSTIDSRISEISSSFPSDVKMYSSSMAFIPDDTDSRHSSQYLESSAVSASTGQHDETSVTLADDIPISTFTTTIASFDIVTVQMQFDGICETIRKAGKMAGIEYFVDLGLLLQKEFNLSKEQITPKKIACNPVQIVFELRVHPAKKLQIIRQRLTELVSNGKVSFPIFVEGRMVFFNATKIVFNPSFSNNRSSYSRIGLSEIDIIVISAVCSASMILVCIGFIICAREYYGKYRTRSFDLSEIDWNSKVDDYTLTKIPRPKVTYSENGMKLHSIGKTGGKEMREKSNAEENETLVSAVRLRVNTDENGLTVGVTGTNIHSSNQSSPSHSYHSCDNRDLTRELLVRSRDSPLHSVDNPIYYADDDRFYVE